jgi:hypothetical protein
MTALKAYLSYTLAQLQRLCGLRTRAEATQSCELESARYGIYKVSETYAGHVDTAVPATSSSTNSSSIGG